jgi:hypothetical protein
VDSRALGPAEEGRHRRGPEPLWGESWYFDFASRDGSLGGFVRVGLYPNQGAVWYWAALVGRGRRLLLVHDHTMEPPRGAALEVRGQGLWSAVNCETPLDHWSIGLEAFAVALDDPVEAYHGERGDLVGLGFDLEWEATAGPFGGTGGYGQACQVSGEILVGDEQLDFDGVGHRGHHWGVEDWWRPADSGWCQAWGVMHHGDSFATRAVGIEAALGPDGLPIAATIGSGDDLLSARVVAPAALLLEGPDGQRVHLVRALCAYQTVEGHQGVGWADWLRAP